MTPFSAVAAPPILRVLFALFLLILVLALVPATFYRDPPRLCSTSIWGSGFHPGHAWLESDEICGSCHDSRIRLEDKLEFSPVSVVLSKSLLLQLVSRYLHHTARSTTTLPLRDTDQNIKLSSATMCKEMNCAVMTRAIFLSHCGVRDVRHTSSLTRDLILLTTRLKENCAPRAHTSPTARQRDEPRTKCVGHATPTNRFSSASQALATKTENRQILHSAGDSQTYHSSTNSHTHACLKHSNFLSTDRMRKSGLSNGYSHETLLLFSLQQFSQGRVKQLLNSSNRKTGNQCTQACGTSLSFRID